ncbi:CONSTITUTIVE EXPRESSER OF PR GENES 1, CONSTITUTIVE EXPRESSER OF PR GENES 30 [Hibiscus trionum]|uniref:CONSTITUTIVE EXPRESSER OF PR GENES 1, CONSTITUTIVE EXPRESSER OF PR GENES 30 n=1 Tax=Hibiscus trionum TaxID=183268 RepID=A0A9W7HC49_HIBTR|nr:CONSTITUTIVE EXPRESSER OF PR GENES 1, CONSTITUTIVE EXPRESSER OF PR GENES 30 [Hibiscus trionum]
MASATASLPHDIIGGILCRLGVKDLLRLRCVSKECCCLIDDPGFIKLHLSHSVKINSNLSLILQIRYGRHFSIRFDSLETFQMLKPEEQLFDISGYQKLNSPLDESGEEQGFFVLGSCNGLLGLVNNQEEVSLWNPSTRRSQMLPTARIRFSPPRLSFRVIFYGFGYDHISDDYKLVRLVQFNGREGDAFVSEVKVYSLKTNSWRRIKDFPFYLRVLSGVSGALVNNALHWLASEKPTETRTLLVAFDLGTEEYRVVELPDCLADWYCGSFHVMDGCLCIIATHLNFQGIDIWMMKEYGVKESWIKFISIHQKLRSRLAANVLPLFQFKNRDSVLLNIEGSMFVYDLRSKWAHKLGNEGGLMPLKTEIMVESLVPPNGGGASFNDNNHRGGKKKRKNTKHQHGGKKTRDDGILSGEVHPVL